LAWDPRGLVLCPLPEEAATMLPDSSAYRSYQLVSDRSRASLRSVDRGSENSQVRLVDIVWSWDANGNFHGVAAFDLEPAGASSCELQLPPGEQLVQAQLDVAPAQLSPLGENHWNVWLGDNKLPRHLEVIFTGTLEKTSGAKLQLTAPTLVELPVERTLWSVWAPDEAGTAVLPTGLPISALRQQQLRLEGTAGLIDLATGLLLDESTEDVTRWYTPWLRRFQTSRADLIQAKSTSSAADEVQAAEAELNAVDQEQSRFVRRLNNSAPENQVGVSSATNPQPGATNPSATSNLVVSTNLSANAAPVVAVDWLHLSELMHSPQRSAALAMIRGQSGPLTLEYPEFALHSSRWRWAAAGCVLAGIISLQLALRFGWIVEIKIAYGPQLIGLIAGLAWWLWLTPSLLGLALIALSLYFLWQYRFLRPTNVALPQA
jgi:hypothetical protein